MPVSAPAPEGFLLWVGYSTLCAIADTVDIALSFLHSITRSKAEIHVSELYSLFALFTYTSQSVSDVDHLSDDEIRNMRLLKFENPSLFGTPEGTIIDLVEK